MERQESWKDQETGSLPEFLLEDPRLPEPDEELLDFALDASETLVGSADTSQEGIEHRESVCPFELACFPSTTPFGANFAGVCFAARGFTKGFKACLTYTGHALGSWQTSRDSESLDEPNVEAGAQGSKPEGTAAEDRVRRKALERNKKAQRTFRQRQKVSSLKAWSTARPDLEGCEVCPLTGCAMPITTMCSHLIPFRKVSNGRTMLAMYVLKWCAMF